MTHGDDDILLVLVLALLLLTFAGPAWRAVHHHRPAEHPISQEVR